MYVCSLECLGVHVHPRVCVDSLSCECPCLPSFFFQKPMWCFDGGVCALDEMHEILALWNLCHVKEMEVLC